MHARARTYTHTHTATGEYRTRYPERGKQSRARTAHEATASACVLIDISRCHRSRGDGGNISYADWRRDIHICENYQIQQLMSGLFINYTSVNKMV